MEPQRTYDQEQRYKYKDSRFSTLPYEKGTKTQSESL